MGAKTLIGIGAGLVALVSSFVTPMIPSKAYVFTASNDGRCEVRQEGRQKPYSWLREKLGNDNQNQRFVRVYETKGRYPSFGTGYVLDDGLVLTANHVTDDMSQPVISDGKNEYTGRVVANDAEIDLALVRIPASREFEATKIGDVSKGEGVSIRTLGTEDWFYSNGSKSLRVVRQVRYNGQIPSPDSQQVEELKRNYFAVEQKINELGSQMDTLMKPYFPESETEKVREEGTQHSLPESSPTKRLIEVLDSNPNIYHFIGKTDGNRVVPGMSGSSVFNRRGELVGVAVQIEKNRSGYGAATWYYFGYTEDMPTEVIEELKRINEQRNALGVEKHKIESYIYHLFNPVIDTDRAVSPSAIVSFLKNYCGSIDSTEASAIQESLEQTLEPHSKLTTASLMRHGSGNNPPRSIDQIIHPERFTKGGWRK